MEEATFLFVEKGSIEKMTNNRKSLVTMYIKNVKSKLTWNGIKKKVSALKRCKRVI